MAAACSELCHAFGVVTVASPTREWRASRMSVHPDGRTIDA